MRGRQNAVLERRGAGNTPLRMSFASASSSTQTDGLRPSSSGNALASTGAVSGTTGGNVTHRVEKIEPFGQRKRGRLAVDPPERLIRPKQYVQLAKLGGLFQEAQTPRTDVVETAADDDLFLRS